MKVLFNAVLALAILCFAIACSQAVPIRVFAAASLTEAFKAGGDAYGKTYGGGPVEFSFAGSSTLRAQILEGAPVDVFASADHSNMDALAAKKLVGPQQIFARNTMVLVLPANSPRVRVLRDLANPGVRIVLAGSTVPAGHYAEQVLRKMTPAVEQDFSDKVLANVVSRETDVKAVLAKVALGEADAGFVFSTDAVAAGKKVKVILIRPKWNVIAEYPIATLTSSNNSAAAQGLIKFVVGPGGQKILRAHGFLSPAAYP
jgi:molybdate transport system substrate-binding protein